MKHERIRITHRLFFVYDTCKYMEQIGAAGSFVVGPIANMVLWNPLDNEYRRKVYQQLYDELVERNRDGV